MYKGLREAGVIAAMPPRHGGAKETKEGPAGKALVQLRAVVVSWRKYGGMLFEMKSLVGDPLLQVQHGPGGQGQRGSPRQDLERRFPGKYDQLAD